MMTSAPSASPHAAPLEIVTSLQTVHDLALHSDAFAEAALKEDATMAGRPCPQLASAGRLASGDGGKPDVETSTCFFRGLEE